MIEVFVMDWNARELCAEMYDNWQYKPEGSYIDLTNEYEGTWSVIGIDSNGNRYKIGSDIFNSGYIAVDTGCPRQRIHTFENAKALKHFLRGKDYRYYNLNEKNKMSLYEKVASGDTSTLTGEDMAVLKTILDSQTNFANRLKAANYPQVGTVISHKENGNVFLVTGLTYNDFGEPTLYVCGKVFPVEKLENYYW